VLYIFILIRFAAFLRVVEANRSMMQLRRCNPVLRAHARAFSDSEAAVITEVNGHVATITLNRPKVLNAMTVCDVH
jgi:hypothetical protein